MPNIDSAAVHALFDNVVSAMMQLGDFEQVNGAEPKSAPGNGLTAAVWIDSIKPIRSSGLAATSGLIVFNVRIYMSFIAQPADAIDPNVLLATTDVMGQFSGEFTFGGTVREVDLLGAYGPGLSAQAGYLNQDGKVFRVMTIVVPLVVDDLFLQAA